VRGEYRSNHEPDVSFVGNLTITAVPSLNGDSAVFHIDLSSPLFYDVGHVKNADFSLASDFETARELPALALCHHVETVELFDWS
jgi:hypothetical protein